ncbi:helix-turn-helix domain-containing protein [Sphingomonas sp. TF3]|uniref:GlxA family transcriptional regulator n=1 Tax=Sphingomonas sp. TF3 TaxID=2495580 RepID=UPI000F860B3A|nr:helix-turn-helix domain-containing protein [Sphingomonas sp. TF3]RUN78311.1 helix-turn-helix domain-containing protein [Sphingomonas sp. TF3]
MTDHHPAAAVSEVALLLYPGAQAAVVHGLADLLWIAGSFAGARGTVPLRITHWALDSFGALARVGDAHAAPFAIEGPLQPDMLIVPGVLGAPVGADAASPYRDPLRKLHAQGVVIASSCNGAFLLGHAGLLDGRRATTHWHFATAFEQAFPHATLTAGEIIVDEGSVVTAGGFMAWTDLGLRLVARLYGPEITSETARFLLLDPAGREQRHYGAFVPNTAHGDASVYRVQEWLAARDGRSVSIPQMAEVAGLEERTFLRRFKAATGFKPTEYAQNLRVAKARDLLEHSNHSIDQIAWMVGYEDSAAFRRIFQRSLGLSAAEYRKRFGVGGHPAPADRPPLLAAG